MRETASTTATGTISVEHFREGLLFVLDEAFENVHGAFLDPGDSFFATLDSISAGQASQPIGGTCSSIAAQVNHVIFYMDVAFRYMQGENPGKQDWGAAWTKTEAAADEWEGLKAALRGRYQQLLQLIDATTAFDNADFVGGAFAMVAHTAYHLGQIREAMCVVRD